MNRLKEETLKYIKETIGSGNVREDEPMADHVTMKVGGPAAYFFTPDCSDHIAFLVNTLKEENFPYYVLGNGSNVIVRDEGYEGAVICLLDNYNIITVDGTRIIAQAGALLKDVSAIAYELGLTGFEFACGIPGAIGGAATMNAGAYDGEMKNVVKSVKVLDKDGNVKILSQEEMDYSYRHSICSSGEYIILEAELELSYGDKAEIKAKIDDFTARREDKQPLEHPSCGSTFKRPEGYYAGKLIMDAGLRGFRIGGASVSEKHCGFIVNDKNGTAADVLAVIEEVKKIVLDKFGVQLECEVKIL